MNDYTSIMIVDGKRLTRYFDGTDKMMMNVMLQGQGADQQKLMSDMGDMIALLHKNARSIRGDNYSVQSARLISAPAPVGRSPQMWFYKANIEIIYMKKE